MCEFDGGEESRSHGRETERQKWREEESDEQNEAERKTMGRQIWERLLVTENVLKKGEIGEKSRSVRRWRKRRMKRMK